MKAAVWHGKKDIRIEEKELKPLKEDEVTVRVAWAGICGSDLHEYQEGPVFVPVEKADELTGEIAPLLWVMNLQGLLKKSARTFKIIKWEIA